MSINHLKYSPFIFTCLLLFSCKENTIPEKENAKVSSEKSKIWSEPKTDIFTAFSYSKLNLKKPYELMNDSIKQLINVRFRNSDPVYMDSLIDFILDLTKEHLAFSFEKCEKNPNRLVKTKKANCIGYAAYFCSVMNYALQLKGLTKKYRCNHFVGKIYCAGQDVHGMFNDPFFKDHDYSTIEELSTGNEIAVDPSLYEYLGVKRVLLKAESSPDKPHQFPKNGVSAEN